MSKLNQHLASRSIAGSQAVDIGKANRPLELMHVCQRNLPLDNCWLKLELEQLLYMIYAGLDNPSLLMMMMIAATGTITQGCILKSDTNHLEL